MTRLTTRELEETCGGGVLIWVAVGISAAIVTTVIRAYRPNLFWPIPVPAPAIKVI